jgi:hypothetical protein
LNRSQSKFLVETWPIYPGINLMPLSFNLANAA